MTRLLIGLGLAVATCSGLAPAVGVLLPPAGLLAGDPVQPVGAVARSELFPVSCPGLALTQGYGPTSFPGEPEGFHHGWDLACPAGTTVVSVTAGSVHVSSVRGGYGTSVHVRAGQLWVRYAHLEAVLVREGGQVAPGLALGRVGSSGYSTGPHLHFEVDGPCGDWPCSMDPAGLVALPPGAGT